VELVASKQIYESFPGELGHLGAMPGAAHALESRCSRTRVALLTYPRVNPPLQI